MPSNNVARVDSSSLFMDTILMPSGPPPNSTLGSPIPCANKDKTRMMLRERASSTPSGQQNLNGSRRMERASSTPSLREGASPDPPRASTATGVSKLRGDALWEALSTADADRKAPEDEFEDACREVSGTDAICHVASVRKFPRYQMQHLKARQVSFAPERKDSASSSKHRSSSEPCVARQRPRQPTSVSRPNPAVSSGSSGTNKGWATWSDHITEPKAAGSWADLQKSTGTTSRSNEACNAKPVRSELVEVGLDLTRQFQKLKDNLGVLKSVNCGAESLLGPTLLEQGSCANQSNSLAELIEAHTKAMTGARMHLEGQTSQEEVAPSVDVEALPAALALATAGLERSSIAYLENEVEAVLAVLDPPCNLRKSAPASRDASRKDSRPTSASSSRAGSQMMAARVSSQGVPGVGEDHVPTKK